MAAPHPVTSTAQTEDSEAFKDAWKLLEDLDG